MKKAMKAVETMGVVDFEGRLVLSDSPEELGSEPVRVILLLTDGNAETATIHDGRMTSIKQVCDFFVKKAKRLETVLEIILVGENEICPEIWTVTSATRTDSNARYPIYDIQSEVARATDSAIVDFRVVNLQDFQSDYPTDILPADSISLWKRGHATTD